MKHNPFKNSDRTQPLEETWEALLGTEDAQLLKRMVQSSVAEQPPELHLEDELEKGTQPEKLFLEAKQLLESIHDSHARAQALSYLALNAPAVGMEPDRFVTELSDIAKEKYLKDPLINGALTMTLSASTKARLGMWEDIVPEIQQTHTTLGHTLILEVARIAVEEDSLPTLTKAWPFRLDANQASQLTKHAYLNNKPIEPLLDQLGITQRLFDLRSKEDELVPAEYQALGLLLSSAARSPSLTQAQKNKISRDAKAVKSYHEFNFSGLLAGDSTNLLRALVSTHCHLKQWKEALELADFGKTKGIDDPNENYTTIAQHQAKAGLKQQAWGTIAHVEADEIEYALFLVTAIFTDTGNYEAAKETIACHGNWNEYKIQSVIDLIETLANRDQPYESLLAELESNSPILVEDQLDHAFKVYKLRAKLGLDQPINKEGLSYMVRRPDDVADILKRHQHMSPELFEEIHNLLEDGHRETLLSMKSATEIADLYVKEDKWKKAKKIIESMDSGGGADLETANLIRLMTAHAANLKQQEIEQSTT